MTEIRDIARKMRALLEKKGAAQYSFEITEREKRELNTEGADFNLFRTTFDGSVVVTVIQDGRKGSAHGSDLTDEGLEKAAEDAVLGAQSSMPDEANVIAEGQRPEVFRTGSREADMERFYDRLKEFLDATNTMFPKVKVFAVIADHTSTHSLYANSNGTEFEHFDGLYQVSLEMCASDGEKTTGLDYVSLSTNDLEKPLMEQGNLKNHLADTERGLIPAAISGKFEGTVIFTPECLSEFAYMLGSNFMDSGVIMDGTSLWLDKIGERVASEKVTMTLKASDPRLVGTDPYTHDGYRAEDVTLIDRGVLKSHVLNLYAARKTGRPVTKNDAFALVMESGDTPLNEIIASVKKGLIVGGFSGGEPTANGEFSGVAKNSFYVEDGKIVGAVTETMINGNLQGVFKNVRALSSELVSDGSWLLPYLACDGIVISSK